MIKKLIAIVSALALLPSLIAFSSTGVTTIDFESTNPSAFQSLNTCEHNSLKSEDPTDSSNHVWGIKKCNLHDPYKQADIRIVTGYTDSSMQFSFDFYATGTAQMNLEYFQTATGSAATFTAKNIPLVLKNGSIYINNAVVAAYSLNKWYTIRLTGSVNRCNWSIGMKNREDDKFSTIGYLSYSNYTFDSSYKELFYFRNLNTTFTYFDNITLDTVASSNELSNGSIGGYATIFQTENNEISTVQYDIKSTDGATHSATLISAYYDAHTKQLIGTESKNVGVDATTSSYTLTHDVSTYSSNYYINTYVWEDDTLEPLADKTETHAFNITYSAQDIFNKIDQTHPNNDRPRLLINQSKIDKLMNAKAKGDAYSGYIYQDVIKQANNYLNASVSTYVKSDGLRLLSVSQTVLQRVATCSLAYLFTGETKYADRAIAELDAAAAFPDWNPYHFLDVGEMSAAFGIGYDWLYNYIPADKKATYQNVMVSYGLNQILDDLNNNPDRKRTYMWSTTTNPNNWTFVCNGGCALSALALYGESTSINNVCGQVFEKGLVNVRRGINLFAPNGSYVEGTNYWNYATKYYALMISAYETATGDDLGLFDMPGVDETVDFVESLNGPAGNYNFSDAGFNANGIRPAQMMWFATKANNPSLGEPHVKLMRNRISATSWEDFLYYDPDMNYTDEERALDRYSDKAEVVTMRSSFDDDALYVGFHNGSNSESHAHRDLGGFVLDYGGQRFITELGSDNYNLSPYKNCYRIRAEGHNTLMINPSDGDDQSGAAIAPITKFESDEYGAFAIADLTSAYSACGATSVRRGIKMCNERSAVLIRDEITLSEAGELYWFAHTDGAITIIGNKKTATIKKNGITLKFSILSGNGIFTKMDAAPLSTSPTVDGQATNTGYSKLAIHLTDFTSGAIVVGIQPQGVSTSFDATTTLDNWTTN